MVMHEYATFDTPMIDVPAYLELASSEFLLMHEDSEEDHLLLVHEFDTLVTDAGRALNMINIEPLNDYRDLSILEELKFWGIYDEMWRNVTRDG